MIVASEAPAVLVDQPRSFPPKGLGQQKAALPGKVQGCGVKLDVLHSGEGGAGPKRHGEPRTLSASGVGGMGVEVAKTTGGEDCGRGVDGLQAVLLVAGAADAIDGVLIARRKPNRRK